MLSTTDNPLQFHMLVLPTDLELREAGWARSVSDHALSLMYSKTFTAGKRTLSGENTWVQKPFWIKWWQWRCFFVICCCYMFVLMLLWKWCSGNCVWTGMWIEWPPFRGGAEGKVKKGKHGQLHIVLCGWCCVVALVLYAVDNVMLRVCCWWWCVVCGVVLMVCSWWECVDDVALTILDPVVFLVLHWWCLFHGTEFVWVMLWWC